MTVHVVMVHIVRHPDDDELKQLCAFLRSRSNQLITCQDWPADQLHRCAQAGVHEWFLEKRVGGQQWGASDVCRGYLQLSCACLTTAFILTQFMGACQRIAHSHNPHVARQWLPLLRTGELFATVGISHLTTSRRYLTRPVLQATPTSDGYVLDGYSPWVTGACHAELVVTGATLPDGSQILCAVPTRVPGLCVLPPHRLIALSASCTGPVQFQRVEVPEQWVLAGPAANVMELGGGGGTGGLQTSTLALGLARAALDYLRQEAKQRSPLRTSADALQRECLLLVEDVLRFADGVQAEGLTSEVLRRRANSLVLRATQAALTAAKGAGFVQGHPVGRWCQEALFFLVWSCPQNVLQAHLCELAGLA